MAKKVTWRIRRFMPPARKTSRSRRPHVIESQPSDAIIDALKFTSSFEWIPVLKYDGERFGVIAEEL